MLKSLNSFSVDTFLKNYWQKKPMVIRAALDDPFWIEPNDLAGLACEETAESRIIMEGAKGWTVEHGPFSEEQLTKLPEKDWTLLVQAVDQWIPEVQAILDYFRFLPSWRLDDIMVSFAPTGGTVSQHYDFFDVFLIQGEGQRKWQVGQVCDSHSEFLPDIPVRILKDFDPKLEVILEPGDILYIPAKHAHLGVSLENSLTYSVGFRAPSISDIVDGLAGEALEYLSEDLRYRDTQQSLQAGHGEIPTTAIEQVKAMLSAALLDDTKITDWFGRYVTERKYPELELHDSDYENWRDELAQGGLIYRHPASRFAYTQNEDGKLFVDGSSYSTKLGLAQHLANAKQLDAKIILKLSSDKTNATTLNALFKTGALEVEA